MKKIFVTKEEFENFISLRHQEAGVRHLIELISADRQRLWNSIITKYKLDPKQVWNIIYETREITKIGEHEIDGKNKRLKN